MSPSLPDMLRTHGPTAGLFFAIGAVAALGLRAGMQEPGPPAPPPEATAATPHHQGPGHPGHAHDGAEPEPAASAPSKPRTASADPSSHTAQPAADREGVEGGAHGVLLDLGNAACPVMGGEPDGETHTDWMGLRVHHCCPGCTERFLKNPESLLDEVVPDWREARDMARAIDQASGEERETLLDRASKRWKVLRVPDANAPSEARPVAPESGSLLVDLGNATCPVMGGEVDGETFTEWNGIRVGHCCAGCSKRFLKDPESLLDEVSPDWRDLRDAIARLRASEGQERERALAYLRSRWTIVREPEE